LFLTGIVKNKSEGKMDGRMKQVHHNHAEYKLNLSFSNQTLFQSHMKTILTMQCDKKGIFQRSVFSISTVECLSYPALLLLLLKAGIEAKEEQESRYISNRKVGSSQNWEAIHFLQILA
jgi:hypothetical protein